MFFLFAVLLGFVGYQLGRSKDPQLPPVKMIGAVAPQERCSSYLEVLDAALGCGQPPSLALLQLAYREAVESGDPSIVALVKEATIRFYPPTAPQEQSHATCADCELPECGDAESWGELANPGETDVEVLPTSVANNPVPIDGVPPDGWSTFCEALRTRKPEWSSENHHGAFEHRKTRLRQLGIDASALGTEKAQYDALCADIADYHRNCNQLVQDYSGAIVDINGNPFPVTPSGVLGLLKAAGPKGAEGWLKNPTDRTKFPNTTEVFLRCNGAF